MDHEVIPMRELKMITFRCSAEHRDEITREAKKRGLSQQKFMSLMIGSFLVDPERFDRKGLPIT